MKSFFWSIIKYKMSYELGQGNLQEQAQNIVNQAQKLNPVWQKFCQNLACRDDLIGDVLAKELRRLLNNCPIHDHKYTYKVVTDEMSVKEFTTPFSDEYVIGSGTIAQVYKVYHSKLDKWLALKVKHPNIDEDITEAYKQYKFISNSIWFPKNLKACGDEFFKALVRQADFKLEFESGRQFRHILKNCSRNSNYPRVFLVPKMLTCSKSLILMKYEKGEYDILTVPDIKSQLTVGLLMIYLQVLSIYNGMIHSDLHWANFSIRLNPLTIILYDFGWVVDMSATSLEFRSGWAKAFLDGNTVMIFEPLIRRLNISEKDKDKHISKIKDIIHRMEKEPKPPLVSAKCKRILVYYQRHGLIYNEYLIAVMYACMNSEQIEKMIHKNMPSKKKISSYLRYAEFQSIYNFFEN